MTYREMEQFIHDNKQRIYGSDAYYQQYLQAKAAYDAIQKDIDHGSPSAATDLMIFTIGNQCYPVGCFNAETIGAIDEALHSIMENAIEQIYLADPAKIV